MWLFLAFLPFVSSFPVIQSPLLTSIRPLLLHQTTTKGVHYDVVCGADRSSYSSVSSYARHSGLGAIKSCRRSLKYRMKPSFAIPPFFMNESVKDSGSRTGVIEDSSSSSPNDDDTDDNENDDDNVGQMESLRRKMFAELEKLRGQFSELTDSLSQAKKEEEETKVEMDRLRAQREIVAAEKEEMIRSAKKSLSDEIIDLADRLEESQDKLRTITQRTKSEISSIRQSAKETENRLRSEISDLQSRLALLRQEAANAAKSRDDLIRNTEREVEEIRNRGRKEMENAKRAKYAEKKALTRENWALETRIQKAEMDLVRVDKELELERGVVPSIPSLKDALSALVKRWKPEVDEWKERRAANEMFFARSLKGAKTRLEEELEKSKLEFEEARKKEEKDLARTVSTFESRLTEKEKASEKNIRRTKERAERAVSDAISNAKKKRISLYQEKYDAVQRQKLEKASAIEEARSTQSALRDRLDAEYENEKRNLSDLKLKAKQDLESEQQRRKEQEQQLLEEMDRLTLQLEQQLKDEKAAAEREFYLLKEDKRAELANSRSRTSRALHDIEMTRSNLVQVQDELKQLEKESRKMDLILRELEDERSSFRKQFRRAAVVAFDRLTLKRWRDRNKKKV